MTELSKIPEMDASGFETFLGGLEQSDFTVWEGRIVKAADGKNYAYDELLDIFRKLGEDQQQPQMRVKLIKLDQHSDVGTKIRAFFHSVINYFSPTYVDKDEILGTYLTEEIEESEQKEQGIKEPLDKQITDVKDDTTAQKTSQVTSTQFANIPTENKEEEELEIEEEELDIEYGPERPPVEEKLEEKSEASEKAHEEGVQQPFQQPISINEESQAIPLKEEEKKLEDEEASSQQEEMDLFGEDLGQNLTGEEQFKQQQQAQTQEPQQTSQAIIPMIQNLEEVKEEPPKTTATTTTTSTIVEPEEKQVLSVETKKDSEKPKVIEPKIIIPIEESSSSPLRTIAGLLGSIFLAIGFNVIFGPNAKSSTQLVCDPPPGLSPEATTEYCKVTEGFPTETAAALKGLFQTTTENLNAVIKESIDARDNARNAARIGLEAKERELATTKTELGTTKIELGITKAGLSEAEAKLEKNKQIEEEAKKAIEENIQLKKYVSDKPLGNRDPIFLQRTIKRMLSPDKNQRIAGDLDIKEILSQRPISDDAFNTVKSIIEGLVKETDPERQEQGLYLLHKLCLARDCSEVESLSLKNLFSPPSMIHKDNLIHLYVYIKHSEFVSKQQIKDFIAASYAEKDLPDTHKTFFDKDILENLKNSQDVFDVLVSAENLLGNTQNGRLFKILDSLSPKLDAPAKNCVLELLNNVTLQPYDRLANFGSFIKSDNASDIFQNSTNIMLNKVIDLCARSTVTTGANSLWDFLSQYAGLDFNDNQKKTVTKAISTIFNKKNSFFDSSLSTLLNAFRMDEALLKYLDMFSDLTVINYLDEVIDQRIKIAKNVTEDDHNFILQATQSVFTRAPEITSGRLESPISIVVHNLILTQNYPALDAVHDWLKSDRVKHEAAVSVLNTMVQSLDRISEIRSSGNYTQFLTSVTETCLNKPLEYISLSNEMRQILSTLSQHNKITILDLLSKWVETSQVSVNMGAEVFSEVIKSLPKSLDVQKTPEDSKLDKDQTEFAYRFGKIAFNKIPSKKSPIYPYNLAGSVKQIFGSFRSSQSYDLLADLTGVLINNKEMFNVQVFQEVKSMLTSVYEDSKNKKIKLNEGQRDKFYDLLADVPHIMVNNKALFNAEVFKEVKSMLINVHEDLKSGRIKLSESPKDKVYDLLADLPGLAINDEAIFKQHFDEVQSLLYNVGEDLANNKITLNQNQKNKFIDHVHSFIKNAQEKFEIGDLPRLTQMAENYKIAESESTKFFKVPERILNQVANTDSVGFRLRGEDKIYYYNDVVYNFLSKGAPRGVNPEILKFGTLLYSKQTVPNVHETAANIRDKLPSPLSMAINYLLGVPEKNNEILIEKIREKLKSYKDYLPDDIRDSFDLYDSAADLPKQKYGLRILAEQVSNSIQSREMLGSMMDIASKAREKKSPKPFPEIVKLTNAILNSLSLDKNDDEAEKFFDDAFDMVFKYEQTGHQPKGTVESIIDSQPTTRFYERLNNYLNPKETKLGHPVDASGKPTNARLEFIKKYTGKVYDDQNEVNSEEIEATNEFVKMLNAFRKNEKTPSYDLLKEAVLSKRLSDEGVQALADIAVGQLADYSKLLIETLPVLNASDQTKLEAYAKLIKTNKPKTANPAMQGMIKVLDSLVSTQVEQNKNFELTKAVLEKSLEKLDYPNVLKAEMDAKKLAEKADETLTEVIDTLQNAESEVKKAEEALKEAEKEFSYNETAMELTEEAVKKQPEKAYKLDEFKEKLSEAKKAKEVAIKDLELKNKVKEKASEDLKLATKEVREKEYAYGKTKKTHTEIEKKKVEITEKIKAAEKTISNNKKELEGILSILRPLVTDKNKKAWTNNKIEPLLDKLRELASDSTNFNEIDTIISGKPKTSEPIKPEVTPETNVAATQEVRTAEKPFDSTIKGFSIPEDQVVLANADDQEFKRIFIHNDDGTMSFSLLSQQRELKLNDNLKMNRLSEFYAKRGIKTGAEPLIYTKEDEEALRDFLIKKGVKFTREANFVEKLYYGNEVDTGEFEKYKNRINEIIGLINKGLLENIQKASDREKILKLNKLVENIASIRCLFASGQDVFRNGIDGTIMEHLMDRGLILKHVDNHMWFYPHKTTGIQF